MRTPSSPWPPPVSTRACWPTPGRRTIARRPLWTCTGSPWPPPSPAAAVTAGEAPPTALLTTPGMTAGTSTAAAPTTMRMATMTAAVETVVAAPATTPILTPPGMTATGMSIAGTAATWWIPESPTALTPTANGSITPNRSTAGPRPAPGAERTSMSMRTMWKPRGMRSTTPASTP